MLATNIKLLKSEALHLGSQKGITFCEVLRVLDAGPCTGHNHG
jgi:hypothetical protein